MKVPTEAEMQAMRDCLELRGSSLWWKIQRSNRTDMTKPAGSKHNDGYQVIGLTVEKRDRVWLAHQIAYYLHHGTWPTQMIDHKDHDKQNNDPENLRLATASLNGQNTSARVNNKLGIKGVRKYQNGYRAGITIKRKAYQKLFPTLQEAIDYRKELEKTYHPWSPSVI